MYNLLIDNFSLHLKEIYILHLYLILTSWNFFIHLFRMLFLKESFFSLLFLIAVLPTFQMHMLDFGSRFRKPKSLLRPQITQITIGPALTNRTATTIPKRVVHRACISVSQIGIKFFSVHGCTDNMVKRCECVGVNKVRCNNDCKRMADYYGHKGWVG